MLLSARMLDSVCNSNDFEYLERVEFTESDAVRVYFQLVDLNKDKSTAGWKPAGRRYMPASGATLSVTLENIDDAKKLVRAATQAYPTSDPSIWYVSVLASDTITGTCNMRLTLTEGATVTRGLATNAVGIHKKANV